MRQFIKRSVKFSLVAAVLVLTGAFATACGTAYADGAFNRSRQINVVARDAGSGTHGAFIEILGIEVRGDDGTVRDMTTIDAEVAPSTSGVITGVAGNPYSIGYISLGSLNDTVTAISVGGVPATAANVQNGSYPLFRTFYIAVQQDLDPLTQDFVNFILSAEGQAIAARNYVPGIANASPYVSGGTFSGTIVVSGSTSIAPLLERIKEAYEDIHPGVTVEIQSAGSSAGINAAISGLADIGLTSRALREAELEQVDGIAIAFDGLAVIVNNANPITNMTPEQIRQIFVGDTTRWNELD